MPKKGYKMPEWRKLEISSRMKGKPKSDSAKKNMKKVQQELAYKKKGKHFSSSTEFKKGQTSLRKGIKRTEKEINRQKETLKNRTDEEKESHRNKISKTTKGFHNSIETEFTSERVIEMHNNGVFEIPPMLGKHQSERQKESARNNTYIKDAIKRDPKILKKMLSFDKPNYKESQLFEILNNIYPHEWKYVGDGSFILDGKNPDFINCNGKKLIIELFGERWHKPEEEEQRKEIFKKFGYNTLIIWVKELRNIENLKNKLNIFNENHKE